MRRCWSADEKIRKHEPAVDREMCGSADAMNHTDVDQPRSRSNVEASDRVAVPDAAAPPPADNDDDVQILEPPALLAVTGAYLLAEPAFDASALLGYSMDAEVLEDNSMCGLANLGSTCYLNAMLTVLSKVKAIRSWLLQHQAQASEDEDHDAPCTLCDLAQDVGRLTIMPRNEPFAPLIAQHRGRWSAGSFQNIRQQDAHEAFQKLFQACEACDAGRLRRLIEVDEQSSARYTTPFWKLCRGIQRQTCACTAALCNSRSVKYEPFACVLVAVDDPTIVSIEDAITRHLVADIPLGFRCGRCEALETTQRFTEIVIWPTVLVLGLKRWHYAHGGAEKIDRYISFETLLPCPDGRGPYTLRGIVVHEGGVGGGHYTSRVRAQDNFWYAYNDRMQPTQKRTSEILTECAYLLLFERS